MVRRRVALLPFLLLFTFAVGCGHSPPKHVARGDDPYSRVATAALDSPCGAVSQAGPIPVAAATPEQPSSDAARAEVVAYFAHPYDDAFFAGGTLTLLGQGGHRVTVVLMSHGEGGRLLEVSPKGEFVERYDVPKTKLVETRDREATSAGRAMHAEMTYLYPAAANADFGKTLACDESLEKWEQTLPGGVAETLRKLVADIRARRPRVIVTSPPQDVGGWFEHGHNKALGALVQLAARMAGDPRVSGDGEPYAVEELVAVAPASAKVDFSVPVPDETRKAALRQYPSQFRVDKVVDVSSRKTEDFTLIWRAQGAVVPPGGSLLADLVAHPRER